MLNKPPNKKLIIFFLTMMSGLTQAGLVLYTPSFLQISQSLHISPSLVRTTLTAYLFGFGISQLFYGPLSDRLGRKKVLLTSMVIFSIACLWSVFSISYTDFLLSRVFQGVGIGACMTLSRSILRDCFSGKEYIKTASWLSSGFAIGLGLTPVIGGHLLDYFSWRSDALKDLSHIAGTAAAFFSCLQMLISALISGLGAIIHENNQIPLSLVIITLGLISWAVFQVSVFRKTL